MMSRKRLTLGRALSPPERVDFARALERAILRRDRERRHPF
jgi:uncharacterized membrane protein